MVSEEMLSTERFDTFLEKAADLNKKVDEELKKLREKILSDETTGDIFTDWAIVNFGTSYRGMPDLAYSLKDYLSTKAGELVLVTETGKSGDYIGKIPGGHYIRRWVGILSPEGLKVQEHPYSAEAGSADQPLDVIEKMRHNIRTKEAKEQPLVLAVATQDGYKIYSDYGPKSDFSDVITTGIAAAVPTEQINEGPIPHFNSQIFHALRHEDGIFKADVDILEKDFVAGKELDKLLYVEIVAGNEAVLKKKGIPQEIHEKMGG